MQIHKLRPSRPVLGGILVATVTLTLTVVFWQGMQATDDIYYAEQAIHLLQEGFCFDGFADVSHKVGRIGVYWPVAAAFWVFGVSDFSLGLTAMVATVGTAVLLFVLGNHLFGLRVGLLAGLLYAFFPTTLYFGNVCYPEPILGCELCAAAVLLLKAGSQPRGWLDWKKLACGLLLGLAYLTSEVGAVMLPVCLFYQFAARRANRSDWSLVVGFLCVLGAEMAFYAAVYGNPLYRFVGFGGDYTSDPMLLAANKDLVERLLKSYPRLFAYPNSDFGFYGPLLIAGGLAGLVRFRRCLFLVLWAAAILAFYNFFSVRFDQYVVLPVAARLIYPACLPLILLSAMLLVSLWQWIGERRAAMRHAFRGVYCTTLACLFASSILVAYLMLNTSFTSVVARNAEATAGYLDGKASPVIVSDERTLRAIRYYRGCNDADTLLEYEDAMGGAQAERPWSGQDVLIVVNGPILHHTKRDGFFPSDPRRTQFMVAALREGGEPVFQSRFAKEKLFHRLLAWSAVQKFMQESRYQTAKQLLAGSRATGWVKMVSAHRSSSCQSPKERPTDLPLVKHP